MSVDKLLGKLEIAVSLHVWAFNENVAIRSLMVVLAWRSACIHYNLYMILLLLILQRGVYV